MDSSKVTLRINHNFPISLQSIDLSTDTLWVAQLEILEVSWMPHNKPGQCEVLKNISDLSTFLENVLEINSSKGEYFRQINPPKTKPLVVW